MIESVSFCTALDHVAPLREITPMTHTPNMSISLDSQDAQEVARVAARKAENEHREATGEQPINPWIHEDDVLGKWTKRDVEPSLIQLPKVERPAGLASRWRRHG